MKQAAFSGLQAQLRAELSNAETIACTRHEIRASQGSDLDLAVELFCGVVVSAHTLPFTIRLSASYDVSVAAQGRSLSVAYLCK